MGRGWTWINENDPREHTDAERATLDALARQWSALHDQEEQERFLRQGRMQDGDMDYDWDDQNERAVHEAMEQVRRNQHDASVRIIEDALEALGARMMRPYEHWNEDERYMEYMESRHDY